MKNFTAAVATVVATALLLTACKKDQAANESAAVAAQNTTDGEQFQPNVQGVAREFTLTLPFGKKPQKVKVEVKDNLAIMEGDIILDPAVGFEGDNAVAIDGASHRWPSSVIPYVITSGHPETADIQWAINHVNANTNLCLVPRTNQTDYVQFVTGSGCASYVGRQGGRQDILVGGCSQGSVAHEILHAAGLWHEQSREDRDSYITINWGNIQDGKSHNFNKHVYNYTIIVKTKSRQAPVADGSSFTYTLKKTVAKEKAPPEETFALPLRIDDHALVETRNEGCFYFGSIPVETGRHNCSDVAKATMAVFRHGSGSGSLVLVQLK